MVFTACGLCIADSSNPETVPASSASALADNAYALTIDTRLRLYIPEPSLTEERPSPEANTSEQIAPGSDDQGGRFSWVLSAEPIAADLASPLAGRPTRDTALWDTSRLNAAGPTTASPSSFRVGFGRDTALIDGGFASPATGADEIGASFFESSRQRYEQFNLDLEWTPMERDASVQWLLISGVQAVRADVARLNTASLALDEARGLVAIPTIGTGVRWRPSDSVILSTTAATQSLGNEGGILDISFNAEFRLAPNVGLTAGYEFYESEFVVDDLRTSLDREGVFARLTIRF